MNNEEKILSMLAEMKEDLAAVKAKQAKQGEQLAAQGERLLNIEMRIENTIIPDIKALAGGHMQLPRQFHKNPRKRQPLKERRDHDRIEKREKSHERYYNEI